MQSTKASAKHPYGSRKVPFKMTNPMQMTASHPMASLLITDRHVHEPDEVLHNENAGEVRFNLRQEMITDCQLIDRSISNVEELCGIVFGTSAM